jgi:hypothetical protein
MSPLSKILRKIRLDNDEILDTMSKNLKMPLLNKLNKLKTY